MRPRILLALLVSWPPVVAASWIASAITGDALALLTIAAAWTAVVLLALIHRLAGDPV